MTTSLTLPEIFNAADHFVDRHIREGRGERTAIRCKDRSYTYADVQAGMNRVGNGLKSLGVRMEERIAVLLHDSEIYAQVFFGAIKTGAVPICLNTLMRSKDYQYFLNDSRARVLIVEATLWGLVDPLRNSLIYLEHVIVTNGPAPVSTLAYEEWVSCQSSELPPAPMPERVSDQSWSCGLDEAAA